MSIKIKVDEKTRFYYEGRIWDKYAQNFLGFRVAIRPTPKGCDMMAYQTMTDNGNVAIYVNPKAKICEGLSDGKARLARLGLFTGQMVKLMLTDFDYVNTVVGRLGRGKAAFYILQDAIEESARIEFAPMVIGGDLMKSMKYMDSLTFNVLPAINDNEDGFVQFITAVKQFAYGRSKGSFTNMTAKKIFSDILLDLEKARKENDPDERVNIEMDIYKKAEPLWGPIADALDDVSPFTPASTAVTSLLGALGSIGAMLGGMPSTGSGSVPATKPESDEDYSTGAERLETFKELSDDEYDEKVKERNNNAGGKAETADASTGNNSDSNELTYSNKDVEFRDASDMDPEDIECDLESLDTYDRLIQSELEVDGFSTAAKKAAAARKIPDFPAIAKHYNKKSYKLKNKMVFGKLSDPMKSIAYYDRVVADHHQEIKKFVDKLRKLFEEDRSEKEFKESGSISMKRISSGKLTTRVFTKSIEPEDRSDVAVMLLVDESGSMWGSRIERAKGTAVTLADSLQQLNIPFYVVGHTADTDGADCLLTHYKHWDDKTKVARASIDAMHAQAGNFDGYAIRVCSEILNARSEKHKLLFVISDGQPACGAYCGMDGYADTADAIQTARSLGQNVIGVGIGDDEDLLRGMYGDDFVRINNLNDIFAGVTRKITDFVKSW